MKRVLIPRRLPKPIEPSSAEREYHRNLKRYAEAFIGKLRRGLKDLVPNMRDELEEAQPEIPKPERKDSIRMDAGGIEKALRLLFEKVQKEMSSEFTDQLLGRWAWAMVDQVNRLGKKNIQKVAKRVGADVEPLLKDGDMNPIFKQIVGENVGLIRSIGDDGLPVLKNKLVAMITADQPAAAISDAIQAHFGVCRNKARLIARDQVGKLNGRVDEYRQRALGGKRYRWRGSQDARERPDHRKLEGKIFSWDKPPVVDRASGRRAHPKGDFQCRCWAEMVMEDLLV